MKNDLKSVQNKRRGCPEAGIPPASCTAGVPPASRTAGVPPARWIRNALIIPLLAGLALCGRAELTVFAAASTTDVMNELAEKFTAAGGEKVRFNFASSGALARQIDAGAPADLFVSANVKWMDAVGRDIDPTTRIDLFRNRLVLIVPCGQLPPDYQMPNDGQGIADGNALRCSDFLIKYSAVPGCRLAVGDVRSVPAGMYAKQALEHAGLYEQLRPKMVMGSNVRTVLLYVERGETDAGIVYLTDAMQSKQVQVLGAFPAASHPPIVYPAACLRGAGESARAFLDYINSPAGGAVWEKYGFERITP